MKKIQELEGIIQGLKNNQGYTKIQVDNKLNNYYTKIQIDNKLSEKQNTITGGATSITKSNLTTSRVLVSNGSGKVDISSITTTKLGYLSNVTSDIQTQINNLKSGDGIGFIDTSKSLYTDSGTSISWTATTDCWFCFTGTYGASVTLDGVKVAAANNYVGYPIPIKKGTSVTIKGQGVNTKVAFYAMK